MISVAFLDVYDSKKFLKVPINCEGYWFNWYIQIAPIKKEERREFELGILNQNNREKESSEE